MKPLFPAFFVACIIAFPFAFAVPDAPASIWFEQNETLHYDNSSFSVNWTQVTNEPVSSYLVYVLDARTGAPILTISNMSASGLYFSGANGMNYTFLVGAFNTTGSEGQYNMSDWISVYSAPPLIEFLAGTPETGAYTRSAEVPISVGFSGTETNKIIFEGSGENLALGTEEHFVRVELVSDPNTAYITIDGGLSQAVTAGAFYTIQGAQIYVSQIYFESGGLSWVKMSLYDPWIILTLNWNGVVMADQFGYYGAFWNASADMGVEGTYMYYVGVSDFLNNTAATETRAITYDITSPQLVMVSPANSTYNSTTIPLNYSAYDLNPFSCWYEYNSSNTTLPGCGNDTFAASGNSSTLTLWVLDAAGNINSASVTFSINGTSQPSSAPVILSTIPSNNTLLESPSITGNTTILSMVTNRVAECKYSAAANKSFENMTLFSFTNSTGHSATISISSGAVYNYFMRCRGPEGNITQEDYWLTFSTASFKIPLQIDPSGIVLKNGSIALELVVGKSQSFNIPIKSKASYTLGMPNVTLSGNGAPYISIIPPVSIPANSTAYMNMSVTALLEGKFNSPVSVSGDNYTLKFSVNMTIVDDYITELNTLKSMRQNLSTRLYTLQFKGEDVDTIISEAESLQLEVNDAISLYNSGHYSEGMEKYLELNDRITALSTAVAGAEAKAEAKGPENSTSVPVSSDISSKNQIPVPEEGNSKIIWYVLGGILLVIVAVVLATSIMPDDYQERPRAAKLLK